MSERKIVEEIVLTPAETAGVLKVSTRTLTRWRAQGVGPRFIRQDQIVRYLAADVRQWLTSNK